MRMRMTDGGKRLNQTYSYGVEQYMQKAKGKR